jgi:2-oxoglutarate ferredoxin oxidoreductase subunit alpha
MDAFGNFCNRYRKDPETGENLFCIVQAEDELGAMGMAVGAGWTGARAFTSTSGPGVSLMSELLGFAYFSEVPVVLFDIQRVGPSTGMPTRTQQSDVMSAAYASHGDTKHPVLFPADPGECFEMATQAFDLADRLQTPVIVLSDLDIGMNDWMCKKLEWDDSYQPDRGKVLDAEALEKAEKFMRYDDVDGDGICARTYPGVHPKGGYFLRGSGHNAAARYTEDSDEYQEVLDRLTRKFKTAESIVPTPVLRTSKRKTNIGVIAYGSSHNAVDEALDRLEEQGTYADYLRLRAFPFCEDVQQFLDAHDQVYVVEQNRDAQMRSLLCIELDVNKSKLIPVLHYGGMPINSSSIITAINEHARSEKAA